MRNLSWVEKHIQGCNTSPVALIHSRQKTQNYNTKLLECCCIKLVGCDVSVSRWESVKMLRFSWDQRPEGLRRRRWDIFSISTSSVNTKRFHTSVIILQNYASSLSSCSSCCSVYLLNVYCIVLFICTDFFIFKSLFLFTLAGVVALKNVVHFIMKVKMYFLLIYFSSSIHRNALIFCLSWHFLRYTRST